MDATASRRQSTGRREGRSVYCTRLRVYQQPVLSAPPLFITLTVVPPSSSLLRFVRSASGDCVVIHGSGSLMSTAAYIDPGDLESGCHLSWYLSLAIPAGLLLQTPLLSP